MNKGDKSREMEIENLLMRHEKKNTSISGIRLTGDADAEDSSSSDSEAEQPKPGPVAQPDGKYQITVVCVFSAIFAFRLNMHKYILR